MTRAKCAPMQEKYCSTSEISNQMSWKALLSRLPTKPQQQSVSHLMRQGDVGSLTNIVPPAISLSFQVQRRLCGFRNEQLWTKSNETQAEIQSAMNVVALLENLALAWDARCAKIEGRMNSTSQKLEPSSFTPQMAQSHERSSVGHALVAML